MNKRNVALISSFVAFGILSLNVSNKDNHVLLAVEEHNHVVSETIEGETHCNEPGFLTAYKCSCGL